MRPFAVPSVYSSGGGGASTSAAGGGGPSPVFTSVLAHSSAPARGPRHFDVLGRRNAAQQQQNSQVTKDQALADHQLQALVRVKGASILRQRLLFLLRKQYEKEFDDESHPNHNILVAVEELITTCDNSDVENAGYLRDFAKKVNQPPPPPPAVAQSASTIGRGSGSSGFLLTNAAASSAPVLSTERMLSLGTPSFILQSSSFGIPLVTESRFGIAAAATSSISQSPSVTDDSEASSVCDEDERAATATIVEKLSDAAATAPPPPEKDTAGFGGLRPNDFYAMRVKRVAGTGTVACPKCLHNLTDMPAKAQVVCADASTNTAERSESEKDFLVAALTKSKADAEKKMDEMKRELQAFKKAKYASQNLVAQQQQTPVSNTSITSTTAAAHSLPGSPNFRATSAENSVEPFGSMSPLRASTPGPGNGAMDDGAPLPPVRANSSLSGNTLNRSQQQQQPPQPNFSGSPNSKNGVRRSQSRGGTDTVVVANGTNNSNTTAAARMALLLRAQATSRELRSKLLAIRSGIRSFQFKEVMHQFSQHVVPQIQNLQAANKRLLDRDYILEKVLLDSLCKVGTMPDAGSPEGYLPEGGPLHVGTYSLLDDRRFLEWTRRINDTLSGKVTAVQAYISSITHDNRGGGGGGAHGMAQNRKELVMLEERVAQLESSLVENECFNVSNILDHTFDSSTAVQGNRRTDLVSLLKHAAETNEEIRLVYVIPNWASKPQLRVKLNMWRQRRIEALQKIEQLLAQELQHFVSSGAQKIMLKGKLMTLRELIQLASRLNLMPSSSSSSSSSASLSNSSASTAAGSSSSNSLHRTSSSHNQTTNNNNNNSNSNVAVAITTTTTATSGHSSDSGRTPLASSTSAPLDRSTPPHSPISSGNPGEHSTNNEPPSAPSSPLNGGMAAPSSLSTSSVFPKSASNGGGISVPLRDQLKSPPTTGSITPNIGSPTIARRSAQASRLPPVRKDI